MADTAPTIAPRAEIWVGSYRLNRQLGTGGMSSVFHAVHGESGLEVALKILPRSLAKNPTLLQRFIREAKSAESLEHPNIVAIYDRGLDQGRHYLVLEYVAGGDLHDRVKEGGPLPIKEAIGVIRTAAEGLKYAASQGVIHRDVKPANLLLTADGQVKVTDLGLALQIEDEDEKVTRDGTTVGTVDYMAPEQARDSRATSARSDIYSLGCTFYYLLTGSPPFPGGDVASKLKRHATEPPPDLRRVRPEASPALSRLVQRMLAKSPTARFSDYDHLIQALNSLPVVDVDSDGDPELIPLDDEPQPSNEWLRPGETNPAGRAVTVEMRPSTPIVPQHTPRAPAVEDDPAPLLRGILEEEEEVLDHLPPPSFGARHSPETPMSQYIVRGLLVGLAAVIALVVLQLLFSRPARRPDAPASQPAKASESPDTAPSAGAASVDEDAEKPRPNSDTEPRVPPADGAPDPTGPQAKGPSVSTASPVTATPRTKVDQASIVRAPVRPDAGPRKSPSRRSGMSPKTHRKGGDRRNSRT